jgi:hypothetical protein
MTAVTHAKFDYPIKTPRGLSARIQWLRDYYFKGAERAWNNEFLAWSTGTAWDVQFNEMSFYIVPETYALLQTLRGSYRQAGRTTGLVCQRGNGALPAPGNFTGRFDCRRPV